jgi:hypothetical protein
VIPLGLKMLEFLIAFSEPPSDSTWLENAQPFIRATVAVVLLPGSNWAKRTCPP